MFRLQELFHLWIVCHKNRPRFQGSNKEEDPESADCEWRSEIHPVKRDLALCGDEVRLDHPVQIQHANKKYPAAQRHHECGLLLQSPRQQQSKRYGELAQYEQAAQIDPVSCQATQIPMCLVRHVS